MLRRRVAGLFMLGIVTIGLSGCLPDNLSGPDPCNEEGTLLNDDFDGSKECGWTVYNRSGATASIEDGVFQLTTSQPGQIWWTNAGRNFDDVIITTTVRQLSGPNDNAFGVICRYQNPENFYLMLISGDGYYAIGKYQSGSNQVTYLSGEGQFVSSEAINQGVASNELRVSCIGNELSLAINGITVANVADPTFVTGDVGMGASTFQPGTTVVQFESIRVIAP
jgi:hypothetical protein